MEIKLEFKKDFTALSGNTFGRETYHKQVKTAVDANPNETIRIVFPERITLIATSFEQGFFDDFIKKYGLGAFERQIEIDSSIPGLKNTIFKNLS